MRGGKKGRTFKRTSTPKRMSGGTSPSYYKEDKGCEKAKKLGYTGGCLTCPFDECLEENREKKSGGSK